MLFVCDFNHFKIAATVLSAAVYHTLTQPFMPRPSDVQPPLCGPKILDQTLR